MADSSLKKIHNIERTMPCKVLLIKPNISVRYGFELQSKKSPPINLGYLAAMLGRSGHEAAIVDMVAESDEVRPHTGSHRAFGMSWEDLAARIKDFGPNVVGLTGFTSQHTHIQGIIGAVKDAFPDILVIAGGVHATCMPRYVLETTRVDYVLQGQAEYTLVELADAWAAGEPERIKAIDGIAYRLGDEYVVTPKLHPLTELDSLPWPARELLSHPSYLKDGVAMPVMTSRSCPGHCSFCSIHVSAGKKWLQRDPIDVVDEIEHVRATWGYRTISITDDACNVVPERLISICKEILRRKLDVRLTFPSGLIIRYITKDLLHWMKQAGAISLSLPVEHINAHIRNAVIGKQLSLDKVFEVLGWCRELKILSIVNFVLGMPGETEDTIAELFAFVREHAARFDSLSAYVATPFPGTAFYDNALAAGYLTDPEKHQFLDFDCYTAHISTESMPMERLQHHKAELDRIFAACRGPEFPIAYIRKAIRKPDEETMDYINTVYFAS